MADNKSNMEDSGNFEEEDPAPYSINSPDAAHYNTSDSDTHLLPDLQEGFQIDYSDVKSCMKKDFDKSENCSSDHVETDGLRPSPSFLHQQTVQHSGNIVEFHSSKNDSEHWVRRDEPLTEHKNVSQQLSTGNIGENVPIIDNLPYGRQHNYYERYSDMSLRKESFEKCIYLVAYNLAAMSHMLAETGLFFEALDEESATCFSCRVNLDLSNLVKEVNLWKAHIQNSPDCAFVQKKIGGYFVAQESVQNGVKENDDYALIKAVRSMMTTPAAEALIGNGYNPWYITNTFRAYYATTGAFLKESELKKEVLNGEDRTYKSSLSTEHRSTKEIIANFQTQFDHMTNNCTKTVVIGVEETQADTKRVFSMEQQELDNIHIRHDIKCQVCFARNVTVSFLPCNHLVCCGYCASAERHCPLCKTYIEGHFRVQPAETKKHDGPALLHVQETLFSRNKLFLLSGILIIGVVHAATIILKIKRRMSFNSM